MRHTGSSIQKPFCAVVDRIGNIWGWKDAQPRVNSREFSNFALMAGTHIHANGFIVIHLMIVVALVGVVLLQRSEGGALEWAVVAAAAG